MVKASLRPDKQKSNLTIANGQDLITDLLGIRPQHEDMKLWKSEGNDKYSNEHVLTFHYNVLYCQKTPIARGFLKAIANLIKINYLTSTSTVPTLTETFSFRSCTVTIVIL